MLLAVWVLKKITLLFITATKFIVDLKRVTFFGRTKSVYCGRSLSKSTVNKLFVLLNNIFSFCVNKFIQHFNYAFGNCVFKVILNL